MLKVFTVLLLTARKPLNWNTGNLSNLHVNITTFRCHFCR